MLGRCEEDARSAAVQDGSWGHGDSPQGQGSAHHGHKQLVPVGWGPGGFQDMLMGCAWSTASSASWAGTRAWQVGPESPSSPERLSAGKRA